MKSLGVGLRGMDERVHQPWGTLEINSQPGRTIVSASVPLQDLPRLGTVISRLSRAD